MSSAPDPGVALLAIYDRALPEVYGYLMARCRDRALAEDLTSETFLAAARTERGMSDPFESLRLPPLPLAPDPAFAEQLRDRVIRAVLTFTSQEDPMTQTTHDTDTSSERIRNGAKHGDISYVTLGVPDLERARAFYGAVLGWRFSPGNAANGARVEDIAPMTGLWSGPQPVGPQVHGAVLGYRVDDISAAIATARAQGGTCSDAHTEPYGIAAEGQDNQGIPFYLHEMAPAAPGVAAANGEREGDMSYLTLVVPDLRQALDFYGAMLGWTTNIGQLGGVQINDTVPQLGITSAPVGANSPAAGAVLCYRVDDFAAATQRVRTAGGVAGEIVQQPYGLEAYCADDQGTPFYLHQLSEG